MFFNLLRSRIVLELMHMGNGGKSKQDRRLRQKLSKSYLRCVYGDYTEIIRCVSDVLNNRGV
jgi:hypothetical protein